MDRFFIIIDSSTLPSNGTYYGPSTYVWGGWWENYLIDEWKEDRHAPVISGSRYYFRFGPNKVFYEGVIDALQCCTRFVENADKIVVLGDCQSVINQLDGRRRVSVMQEWFDRCKIVLAELKQRNIEVKFKYLGEDCHIYRRIDKYSKELRKVVPEKLELQLTSPDLKKLLDAANYKEV